MYKKGNQGANTHGNCYITPGYRVLNWYGSIPLKWADDDRDLFSQPLSLSPPPSFSSTSSFSACFIAAGALSAVVAAPLV